MWYGLIFLDFRENGLTKQSFLDRMDAVCGDSKPGNPAIHVGSAAIPDTQAVYGHASKRIGCDACNAASRNGQDGKTDTIEEGLISDRCHADGYRHIADRIAIVKAAFRNGGEHRRQRDRSQLFTAIKAACAHCGQLAAEGGVSQLFTFGEAFRAETLYVFESIDGDQLVTAFKCIVTDRYETVGRVKGEQFVAVEKCAASDGCQRHWNREGGQAVTIVEGILADTADLRQVRQGFQFPALIESVGAQLCDRPVTFDLPQCMASVKERISDPCHTGGDGDTDQPVTALEQPVGKLCDRVSFDGFRNGKLCLGDAQQLVDRYFSIFDLILIGFGIVDSYRNLTFFRCFPNGRRDRGIARGFCSDLAFFRYGCHCFFAGFPCDRFFGSGQL